MKIKTTLIATLSLVLALSSIAAGNDKKKAGQRGMLESMQSVPCGAKERGLTGVGSVFGSVGVQHVNSQEQLCPQYLLRTDDMEYHIRPLEKKHAAVLPVGREAVFKIKKDRMFLRLADGDNKAIPYQVVAMQPMNANSDSKADSTAYHPADKPMADKPPESRSPANSGSNPPPAESSRGSDPSDDHPPQQ